MSKRLFSIVAGLASLTVTAAHAAEPVSLKLAKSPFAERFDGTAPVPVSGNLIVGVSVGRFGGRFTPKDIRVDLAARPRSGHLCLGVFSRDGRYASENLYNIPERPGGTAVFDFRSHHLDRISSYQADHIAVLIRDVPTCAAPEIGEVLPNVASQREGPYQLRVAVNAPPDRVSATLFKGAERISAESTCDGDRKVVSIAFSTTCVLNLPPSLPAGSYRLNVSLRERFEVVERSVTVRLTQP